MLTLHDPLTPAEIDAVLTAKHDAVCRAVRYTGHDGDADFAVECGRVAEDAARRVALASREYESAADWPAWTDSERWEPTELGQVDIATLIEVAMDRGEPAPLPSGDPWQAADTLPASGWPEWARAFEPSPEDRREWAEIQAREESIDRRRVQPDITDEDHMIAHGCV
jgi:hypothetical protein